MLLALLLLTSIQTAHATADDCSSKFEALNQKLEKSFSEMNRAQFDGTMRKKFLESVEKMSDADIRGIFGGPNPLTFESLDEIWWAGQSRAIKMKPEELARITYLRDVARRNPEAFEKAGASPLRFRMAVKATLAGKGTLEQNLAQTEENLLMQAIQEGHGLRNASNGWYDRFVNFFSPHAERMNKLMTFNNNIRKSIEEVTVADEPVADALQQFGAIISAEEKASLEGMLADTQSLIRKPTEQLKAVYGRDISSGSADVGEIRLREIATKIEKGNSEKQFESAVLQSEKDMDAVERIENEAKRRAGKEGRTPQEVHPRELQIRHAQWKREMAALKSEHDGLLDRKLPNSDYDVHASWTVTVNHSKRETRMVSKSRPDGKGGTEYYQEEETYTKTWTSTYEESGTFTLDATFGEAIDGNISPSSSRVDGMLPSAQPRGMYADSASNGSPTITWTDTSATNRILSRAKSAREVEKPMRDKMDLLDEMLNKIRGEHAKGSQNREAQIKQLQEFRDEIVKTRQDVWDKYRNKENADIQRNWADDSADGFHARVKSMNERLSRMERHLEYFQEQLNRNMPDLEIRYHLPNYSRQVEELERIRSRARTIQAVGGVTGAGATGGGAYYLSDPEHREDLQKKADELKTRLTGVRSENSN